MSEPPPDIFSSDWAWPGLRRHAFQMIAWGYQFAETEIRQCHEEEDITGLICKGVKDKYNQLDDATWEEFNIYRVINEAPVDDFGSRGKKRPRIDILIEHSGTRPPIPYCFEAKRCARKVSRSKYTMQSWYVNGITSYLERRYAKGYPEAAMIGLIQSDDVGYGKSKLATCLNSVPSLACRTELTDVDIVADLPGTSVSQHRRNDGTLIDLHHIFLDCIAS